MRVQSREDGINVTVLEFLLSLLSPLADQISAGTIDVFANLPKMLCRVEQIHDLHRLGRVF